jgi:putative DNA primase/helicase
MSDFPDLCPHIAKIAQHVLGEPNKELSTFRQWRFGSHGSVAVEIAGPGRGRWFDHEAGIGGGPWELLTIKGSMRKDEAIKWLRESGILGGMKQRIVAAYDYRDEGGELLFQVVRFDPKDFRQRRPDGKGGWIWEVKGTRQVPYHLRELIAASLETPVWIVEGEKDVDRLASLGFVATCNAGGAAKANGRAGANSKWPPALNPFFAGRDVVIIPDNDDAGRDHSRSVAGNLTSVARSVRIFELLALPEKGDVSDWLDAGGTPDELQRLAGEAPLFKLGAQSTRDVSTKEVEVDEDTEIARLAALPPIQCDRELPAAAEQLGCRVPTLRAEVKAARGNDTAITGQGRPLELPEPDAWPQPVDGAELLDDLAQAIQRYVVLDPHEADVIALWVLAVYAFDAWTIFPRLFVTAPEKQCGKTTLLDVLSRLVPKPLGASSITPAALFRTIEAARPTFLLDEADAYARENEDLRAILDAGHRRDGAVIRTVGDNHEPRQFSAWAPVALAAIGHLHGTIEDRSITIRLHRRRQDEPVESLRLDRSGGLDELKSKAARWAADHRAALAEADPTAPVGIYNRAADNWRPLLAVAAVAGGQWPDRASDVAVTLTCDSAVDNETTRTMLLADLRELFNREPSGVLFTREILGAFHKDETRPWPEWKNGKPITDRQLATLLKPYKIQPRTVRRGSETEKGYKLAWFEDTFVRYLPPRSVTASQMKNSAGFGTIRSVTPVLDVTDQRSGKASISAGCDGVTDQEPMSLDEVTVWTA